MATEDKNLAHAQQAAIPEIEALKEWWKAHGNKVSYALIAVAVAVIGVRYHGKAGARKAAEAFADFETAATPEAYEKIVADGKSPAVTALSRLRLGHYYFTEGRYDAAQSVFEAFLKDQPRHPHAPIAQIGLAYCAEAMADVESAAEMFRKFTEENAASFLEPMARAGHGRCLILAGRKDEGKDVLDRLITEYAGTEWAAYADEILRSRDNLVIPPPPASAADETDFGAFINSAATAAVTNAADGAAVVTNGAPAAAGNAATNAAAQ